MLNSAQIISFSFSPPWPKISFGITGIGTLVTVITHLLTDFERPILLGMGISTVLFIIVVLLILIVPHQYSSVNLTYIQKQPDNSIKSHHNNKIKINGGVGFIDIYVDPPKWTNGFAIKLDIPTYVDVIEWETKYNLPASVRFEDGILKSDEVVTGFPMQFKLYGDAEELGEGDYPLKFIDENTGDTIKELTLDCDPEPPDSVQEDESDDTPPDEWM